jgi:hypothetical protein
MKPSVEEVATADLSRETAQHVGQALQLAHRPHP